MPSRCVLRALVLAIALQGALAGLAVDTDPSKIGDAVQQAVRDAVQQAVQQATQGATQQAQQAAQDPSQVGGAVHQAVQDNAVQQAIQQAVQDAKQQAQQAVQQAVQNAAQNASQVGDAVQQAGSKVADDTKDVVEDVASSKALKERRHKAEEEMKKHMEHIKAMEDEDAIEEMEEANKEMEEFERKRKERTQKRQLASLGRLAVAPAIAIAGFAACYYFAIDSEALKEHEELTIRRQKKSLMMYVRTEAFKIWGGFLTTVCVLFWGFSSGLWSLLLTLSSIVSTFSFLMVAVKIESSKTVKGVSLKMMECYILIFCCRLAAILPFEEYLPGDSAWLYQLGEATGFCLAGSIVYFCRFRYKATYNPETDTLNNVWLIAPAFALSLILHSNRARFLPCDIAWTFALYLESVAVLCQLFMFLKEGVAQAHTTHFLAAQALAKLISFIFWAFSRSTRHLSDKSHPMKQYVGNWVVVLQLVQLLVMGDFIYQYLRCVSRGISLETLPTCGAFGV